MRRPAARSARSRPVIHRVTHQQPLPHARSLRTGSQYGQAFELHGMIRDTSAQLLDRGVSVPALPAVSMRILQQAARGESVPDADLHGVLEAARRL